MLDENLFKQWLEKEKKGVRSNKRSYLHFDRKINIYTNQSFFKSYFSNIENVSKHSFYPFISFNIVSPRYKKTQELSPTGKAIRRMDLKKRPIAYAAHFDAFIYSWYSTLLTSRYISEIEKSGIEKNVLAYIEKGASNIEFAHEVFSYVESKGECVVLAFDINSFFDGLDHEHLKKMWNRLLGTVKLPSDHFKVFKSLTSYSYVNKEDLQKEFPTLNLKPSDKGYLDRICSPSEFRKKVRSEGLIKSNSFRNNITGNSRYNHICGIPQGSPLSACLSNIYMLEFDERINVLMNDSNGLYRRYSDDLIVVTETNKADRIKALILKTIESYHLLINDDKTEITYFRKDSKGKLRGFDFDGKYKMLQYLGFEFSGENTYIRSSSMSRYNRRLVSRIKENIKAAYGKNSIGHKVFKKKLINRYTDKGERNFLSYGKRAGEHMNSPTIRKQIKNSLIQVVNKFTVKKRAFEEKKRPKKLMK